jgi:hypothetical protein
MRLLDHCAADNGVIGGAREVVGVPNLRRKLLLHLQAKVNHLHAQNLPEG